MNAQTLKSILHESIENIDDVDFLLALKQIIDPKFSPSEEIVITSDQVHRVEKLKEQIRKGNYITNEQAEIIVNQWLSSE